jgi:hypothetical protein
VLGERLRVLTGQRQAQRLVEDEVQQHVQLVAVPAEVAGELVGCHVGLAEQDRITTPAREEFPHVAQGGVGIVG